MKIKLLIGIALSAFIYSSNTVSAEDTNTLCDKKLKTLFSCRLLNNKLVSVCATESVADGHGYVEYKYGSGFNYVDLEMSKGIYSNIVGNSKSIVAINGSYKYVVFQSTKTKSSGIKVMYKKNEISSYTCSTYQTFKYDMLKYIPKTK